MSDRTNDDLRDDLVSAHTQTRFPAGLVLLFLFVVTAWLGLGCFGSDSKSDTVVVVTTNIVDGRAVVVTNTVPADSVEAADVQASGPRVLYTKSDRILEGRDFNTPWCAAPGPGLITAEVDWEEDGTMSAWLREGDILRRRQWHGRQPIVFSHPTVAGAGWNVHISAGVTTRFSVTITYVPE